MTESQGRNPLSRPDLWAYAEASSTPLSPFLDELRTRFASEVDPARGRRQWISGATEARFLAALVHARQARNVLELGTLVGYGTIAMAAALPQGGRVTTCEIDREYAEIARRNIKASGYADRIDVRVAPAMEVIESLPGPFDLVYLDADKVNYLAYYHALLPKLGQRGVLVADNTLWLAGAFVAEGRTEGARAVDEFNRFLARDSRVLSVLLPFGDGVTVVCPVEDTSAAGNDVSAR